MIGPIEAAAARLVATRGMSPEGLAALEAAVAEMERALAADDLDGWAGADARFHRTLVECSGNRRIAAVVNMFWDQAHRARMATLRIRPKPVASNMDHAALVAAIRRGDAAAAEAVHRRHRMRAGQMRGELIERLCLDRYRCSGAPSRRFLSADIRIRTGGSTGDPTSPSGSS